MRFGRMQFTVRQWMVVVAITAVVASVPAMRRRSNEFRLLASLHRMIMEQATVTAAERESGPVGAAELVRLNRQFSNYHLAMIEKYEFGSRYPWLSFASRRAVNETGGLERGYTWFNLHCRLGGPGMQDRSWGKPRSGSCPLPHRTP